MIILFTSIFFIKLSIIYFIYKKFGILSPHFFILIIFFLYGQCLFIDNILFGIEEVRYVKLKPLRFYSIEYLQIVLLYFLFFLGFFIVSSQMNIKKNIYKEIHIYLNNNLYNKILYFIISLIIMYYLYNLAGASRLEKINFNYSNKFLSFIINSATFGSIILVLKIIILKQNNFVIAFVTLVFIYGFLEGGREIFIYLILTYLFLYEYFKVNFKTILISSFIIFLFLFWKLVGVYILQLNDINKFISVLNDLDSVSYKFGITFLIHYLLF